MGEIKGLHNAGERSVRSWDRHLLVLAQQRSAAVALLGRAGLEFLSGLHVAGDTSSVWISIMMAILLSYRTCTGASGDVHTAALACLSN